MLRRAALRAPRRPCGARGCAASAPRPAKPFFVTTPIYYVNGDPHIGHLFSSLLADVAARHARLAAPDRGVLFSTGTDEHGGKVLDASVSAGSPSAAAFCDAVSARFEVLGGTFGISADVFVRTTQNDHARVVAWLWARLVARGAIYLGRHEGWYCRSDEAFLTDAQAGSRYEFLRRKELLTPEQAAAGPPLAADDPLAAAVSLESGQPAEWLAEDNYRFRLGEALPAVEAWLGEGASSPVAPAHFALEARAMLLQASAAPGSGVGASRDVSVSRRREAVPWALPVPGDPAHSVYVWVDALANYLTVALHPRWAGGAAALPVDAPWEELFPAWPADVQVCGKDILRFHAVLWPALLSAAGLPPPRRVVVHGHWTVGRVKMSKSLGNVVDPTVLVRPGPPSYRRPAAPGAALLPTAAGPTARVPTAAPAPLAAATSPQKAAAAAWATPDAVRFFLAREGAVAMRGGDADFSAHALQVRAAEVADGLGNLASRLLSGPLLRGGRVPRAELCDPAALLRALSEPAAAGAASVGIGGGSGGGGNAAAPPSETELQLVRALCGLRDTAGSGYACADPGVASEAALGALVLANRAFNDVAPWALHKRVAAEPADAVAASQLARALYLGLESLRVVGTVLAPVTPLAAAALLRALGFSLQPSSEAPSARRPLEQGLAEGGDGAGPAPLLRRVSWADACFGAVLPGEYALPLAAPEAPPLLLFPKAPPPPRRQPPGGAVSAEA